jgi:alanyl-tRNA synthetase
MQLLGARDPLMYRLVPALIHEMGLAYPELVRAEALMSETLKLEETRFRKTLERGLSLLGDASQSLNSGDVFDGETAFKLYDTFGFPLDLTQDALRQRGVTVDTDAFSAAMQRQKAEARANWSGSGDTATESVWFLVKDRAGSTEFLGYETERAEGVVTALVRDGAIVESAAEGEDVAIIVSQTPFYGESGGQQGDTGIISGDGFRAEVRDTLKKADGVFVHYAKLVSGSLNVGAAAELAVDRTRRTGLRANHSATHLLHEAMRHVLGTHVAQKGSLVAPDRLRFDFSHPKPVSGAELAEVEAMANEIVLQNAPVTTRLMAVDDAIASGAMALFGEKYGDEVRVVSMGTALHGDKTGKAYSIELCGGTHARQTGDIGLVRIVSEGAVAAGVRRLEALTGEDARRYLDEQDRRLKAVASILKTPPAEVLPRIEQLLEERKKLDRDLRDANKKLALGAGASDSAEMIGAIKFVGKVVTGVEPRDLKPLASEALQALGSGIVGFVGVSDEGKASAVVGVSPDLRPAHSAIDLVKLAAAALGGSGGGGRPDMAQAGGPDGSSAEAAIDAIRHVLKS